MQPELTSTYRIQLTPDFGFDRAATLAGYLDGLGVSHLYASPYLQAVAGSTHGYDIVDPGRVSDDLGGADAHARMCQALQSAGLGHVIDVVPNHMAIKGKQNPWWGDVLENGHSSRYATFFDVDWDASEDRWPNKIHLPLLGDHYGRVLEAGHLKLTHRHGVFFIRYEEHVFPVDPSSLPELIGRAAAACGSDFLAFLAESYGRLPRPTVTARERVDLRHRDKAVLGKLLAETCRNEPPIAAAIDAEVERLNGDPDALDAFIGRQNYRLAFWRTAIRELGYRRFFDVKDLVGLRVEDIEVFRLTHALPIEWVRRGWAQGLRIDHPDGLREPAEYFKRLREACPDAWIVAEKILETGETLPSVWPIDGATGYDFMNLASGLFVDPAAEQPLTQLYDDFAPGQSDYGELVRVCKRQALNDLLGGEVNRLTSLFVEICERHRCHCASTGDELSEALCGAAVHFPVYRSYVSAAGHTVSVDDKRHITQAIEGARAERPDMDPELFGFLKNLLLLRVAGSLESELAMRFQQLSGPAMAKGFEDTALYRYNRLTALNEVGGDPGRFGVLPAQFHEACAAAQAERPRGMLASTTHDTKRSEDVRARLAVLSEMPEAWAEAVRRWSERTAPCRIGDAPGCNAEYLFYQTLAGAWPIGVDRMQAYMKKAVREAMVHTSWNWPNDVYESGVRSFVEAVMGDDGFIDDLKTFVAGLLTPGRINSLAQTLIKLTAPGVPDIYQGAELWNLRLVDPDSRQPVDFDLRQRLLGELPNLSLEDIVARMDEGLPKLWTIRQALHLRRRRPELFGPESSYRPAYAQGVKADHLVAFVRAEGVMTIVPRLTIRLQGDWAGATLDLPAGRWLNILTDDELPGGSAEVESILKRFPIALLVKQA